MTDKKDDQVGKPPQEIATNRGTIAKPPGGDERQYQSDEERREAFESAKRAIEREALWIQRETLTLQCAAADRAERALKINNRTFWAALASAILLFVYVVETHSIAVATSDGNVLQQRAWLLLDDIDLAPPQEQSRPDKLRYVATIRNFGTGPATDVAIRHTEHDGMLDEFPSRAIGSVEPVVGVLGHQQMLPVDVLLPDPWDMGAPPHVFGSIEYTDQFGNRRHTRFCRYIRRIPEADRPIGEDTIAANWRLSPCPKFNDAD